MGLPTRLFLWKMMMDGWREDQRTGRRVGVFLEERAASALCRLDMDRLARTSQDFPSSLMIFFSNIIIDTRTASRPHFSIIISSTMMIMWH